MGPCFLRSGVISLGPRLSPALWHAHLGSVEWIENPAEAVTLGSSN